MTFPPPAFPLSVARTLRGRGHEAYFVGGCVRDRLLGRAPKDWDLVTSATPDAIEALFPKTLAIGKAFGIVTVVGENGETVEVATYRADSPETADSRHPASIAFATRGEDAKRRDFTVNALYMDPESGEILDTVGGKEDLEKKLVRAIGDPAARFREDALRILRAVRFSSVLGFAIEPATLAAAKDLCGLIERISRERVLEELTRALVESPKASDVLDALDATGLLGILLPEVSAMKGVEQPPAFHPEGDVFVHTRLMLSLLPFPRSPRLAWATLLHDAGKPPTAALLPGKDGKPVWRFMGHAEVGAEMADGILRRFKASKALRENVVELVARHMNFVSPEKMRLATIRRYLASPLFEDQLELLRLDCLGCHGDLSAYGFLRGKQAEFAAEPELPPPLVRGKDLIAMGLVPSPRFKKILSALMTRQLEGETSREALLAEARRLAAE
jgi:poly(A) polymerase